MTTDATTDVQTDTGTTDADQNADTTDVQTDTTVTDTDSQTDDVNNDQTTDTDQSDDNGTVDDDSTTDTTYADFDMKEGMELDTAALELAKPLFVKHKFSQEDAQEFVNLQSDLIQAGEKQRVEAFNEQVATWREESANDSEFGGEAFDENKKLAQSAVNKFGTPELKQLLEDYGVGNHPEIVRFMVKVGKLTAEDVPGNDAGATGKAADRVSILYPNARKD